MDIFEEAICFAVRAHAGTLRKGSNLPYILHPMEAAEIVATMTDDRAVLAAAVLHDVLEDTDTTQEQLIVQFGKRVADLVALESEDKRRDSAPEDTWLVRKTETISNLRLETDINVKIIALADKLSNMRATARDCTAMGECFWERFHVKDKALHGWYYGAIADVLEELRVFPAWHEYRRLVDAVFSASVSGKDM